MGITKNLQKCNSHFRKKTRQAAMPSSNLLCEVNIIMTTIAMLLGAHTFCADWAILASLREHLVCRCLPWKLLYLFRWSRWDTVNLDQYD